MKDFAQNPPTLEEMKQEVKAMGTTIADGSNQLFDKLKQEIDKAPSVQDVERLLANALTQAEDQLNGVKDKLKEMYESMTSKSSTK